MTVEQKNYYFSLWEKDFYDKFSEDRRLENKDFKSISIGFFIAVGLHLDSVNEMYNYCISRNKF